MWLTEFSCNNAPPEKQLAFQKEILPYFDANPHIIERYAWFAARPSSAKQSNAKLIDGNSLTELGIYYNSTALRAANVAPPSAVLGIYIHHIGSASVDAIVSANAPISPPVSSAVAATTATPTSRPTPMDFSPPVDSRDGRRQLDTVRASLVFASSNYVGEQSNYGFGATYWSYGREDNGSLPLDVLEPDAALLEWGQCGVALPHLSFYFDNYIDLQHGNVRYSGEWPTPGDSVRPLHSVTGGPLVMFHYRARTIGARISALSLRALVDDCGPLRLSPNPTRR